MRSAYLPFKTGISITLNGKLSLAGKPAELTTKQELWDK